MTEKTNKLPKVVYSVEEEDWLVSNALEYRNIIENKRTDGVTKRDKGKAWEEIAKAFNIAPPSQERSVKSLPEKYQKVKQQLKNRVFYFSKDAKQTGGGPPKKELPALSESMQELFKILIPSTYGLLAATGDGDYIVVNNPALEPPIANISQVLSVKEAVDEEMFVYEDNSSDVALADKAGECLDNQNYPFQTTESKNIVVEHTWERVNPAKLRKPPNPLINNRRRRHIEKEMEASNKIPKLSEERHQHLATKHKIELEIMDGERERYKLERERAALDVQRASFERDRAEFDRERSIVELQRAKNQLACDNERHNIRLAILKQGHTESIQTTVPTAAAKKFFF